jgi:uncharacterized membrane protein
MMAEPLNLLMRWLHISSVAGLVGGMIYGRVAVVAAAGELEPEKRQAVEDRAAALFRPIVATAMICLILSGVYNIVSYTGHTTRYHILLGIKLLLVAHIFASALMVVQPGNKRRGRQMTGASISGLIVIAISAYLRTIY